MIESQLIRIGLIRRQNFEFALKNADFEKMLGANLENSPIGGFTDRFDSFENSNYIYKGQVQNNSFCIKRMNSFSSRNHTLIRGEIHHHDNATKVTAEFNALSTNRIGLFIAFSVFLIWITYSVCNGNYVKVFYISLLVIGFTVSWVYTSSREIKEMVRQFESDMLYLIEKQIKRSQLEND